MRRGALVVDEQVLEDRLIETAAGLVAGCQVELVGVLKEF